MNRVVRQLLPAASLIFVFCLLFALKPDEFMTAKNLSNVLRRSSVNGIIAVGMTAVIVSGLTFRTSQDTFPANFRRRQQTS